MTDEAEEILDLVDEHDKVIGTVKRGEFNHVAHKHGYVRASEAFIINDNGELWIPRRTASKTHAPNGLDFSVSEHVGSGETYLEASIRGFQEELQTKVAANDLKLVGTIKPTDNMPWFATIFVFGSNLTPVFNPQDFSEGMWILPVDLLRMLDGGEPAKKGLSPAIRFLQSSLDVTS